MRQYYILLFFIIYMISCGGNTLEEAHDSLQGSWSIDKIVQSEGERSDLGIIIATTTEEMGNLGSFEFGATDVEFQYNSNLTLTDGTSSYELFKESVNCGFTNCTKFTLELESGTYEVEFGDQTADAHENAMEIHIIMESQEIGPYLRHDLFLTKM